MTHGPDVGMTVDRLRGKSARYAGVTDAWYREKPQSRIIAMLAQSRAFMHLLELTDIDYSFSASDGWYGSVYFPINEANIAKLNELLDAQEVVHAARTDRI